MNLKATFFACFAGLFCLENGAAQQICINKALNSNWPDGVANVELILTDPLTSNTFKLIIDTTFMNGCRQPDLTGLPNWVNPVVVPTKDNNPLNGVSTFDLVRINHHILGTKPFTNGYQFVAADINRDKKISIVDLLELRYLILGVYTDFPNNTSWRFIDKKFKFDLNGIIPPLKQKFKEFCPLSGLLAGKEFEFWAVKIGDVTGDVIGNNLLGPVENRTRPTLRLLAADRELQPGDSQIIQFFPEKTGDWLGWQAALLFDENDIEIDEILPETPDGSAAQVAFRTAPGRLAMNWFSGEPQSFSPGGAAFISLKIRALRKIRLSEAIKLEAENLPAEAYAADETPFKIELQFLENGPQKETAEVSVFPNPFSESVFLKMENPPVGECFLEVFDRAGQLVFFQKMDGETAEISGEKLGAGGSYFFRIADSRAVKAGSFFYQK